MRLAAHAPSPFTHAGHYLVLDKLSKNGKKFRIADPNQTSSRHFDGSYWSANALRHAGVDNVWWFLPPKARHHGN